MKAVILLLFISLIQLQLTEGKESPQTDQATGRQAVLAPQAREVAERKQRKVKTNYKVKKGMKKDRKKKESRKQQIRMRENENKGSKNPKSLMKEKEKKGSKKSGRFPPEDYDGVWKGKQNQDYTSFVQTYKCDIFGYTRDFSTAQTQFRRADRILVNVRKLDDYKSRFATHFNDIIETLELVTEPSTTFRVCKGSSSETRDSIGINALLTNLRACRKSSPLCDKAIIPGYSAAVMTSLNGCRSKLLSYTTAYKKSIFEKSNQTYANVCKNLGSPWNSNTGALYDTPHGSEAKGLEVTGVNPEELYRAGCYTDLNNLDRETKHRLFQCRSNIVAASWGTCINFLKLSISFVNRCGNPWQLGRTSSRNANTFTFNDITNIIDHIEKLNDLSQLLEAAAGNATNFQDTLTAMNVSTGDGTTCTGVQISEQAKNIYKILKNCSRSIPAICDISLVPHYNDIQAKIKSCSPKLEQYITQYELSTNTSETVDEMTLLMETFQINSSMLIPGKNWSQWINDLEKNITANGDGSNSSGDKLKQLMDELIEDDCFCHTFVDVVADVDERLSKCTDVNLTGSLGNCTLTQQAAMRYVNSCRLCTVTVSTATTGRYKNYAKKNFNKMAHN